MIISPHAQGTDEWKAERVGIPTASEFDKIITTKGDSSKSRTKYMYQLAGERITGVREEGYKNGAMERGQLMEDEARQLYTLVTGNEVRTTGICFPDANKRYGASPDGLIADEACLELKCPSIAVHVEYLLNNKLPTEYFCQVQGQLLVTGMKYCHFMSYFPGLNPLIIKVMPDEVFIKALKVELELFCRELAIVEEKLRGV